MVTGSQASIPSWVASNNPGKVHLTSLASLLLLPITASSPNGEANTQAVIFLHSRSLSGRRERHLLFPSSQYYYSHDILLILDKAKY